LGDDRGIRAHAPQGRLRADRAELLVDDRGHDDVAAQALTGRSGRRREARGEPALHVVRAAPVQAAAVQARAQGLGHPAEPDRVEVAVEEERPAAAAPAGGRDHVRTARGRLLDLDLEARPAGPGRDELRRLRLAPAAEPPVHRVDLHEPLEQREDLHRGEPILGAWTWPPTGTASRSW